MNSLYKSYNRDVFNTYIIHLPMHRKSLEMAERCLETCNSIGQKAELFEGFDGTDGDKENIKIPVSLKNQSWLKWLKITDQFQSASEIAISLSHIALWVKCMEVDSPIVILEHDAIMVKPYKTHKYYNAISYLGSKEQLSVDSLPTIPIHSSINKNWNFINRAHAYCIDPSTANKLFINVLERGIFESADVMIMCDSVAIIQDGFYAFDKDDGFTTQRQRKGINDHRSMENE